MPSSKGLTGAWRAAAVACPVEWAVKGAVQGPREADPAIRSSEWVRLATSRYPRLRRPAARPGPAGSRQEPAGS